eukprot:m.355918 g.355918  ORF g.355918 m.355918 type:complete len:329 (-) comp16603_c0_seq2:515-1501(-)
MANPEVTLENGIPVVVAENRVTLVDAGFTDDAIERPFRVVIPQGVTEISPIAFVNCFGLVSVSLPDGLTTIGNWAFENCAQLASVTLPDGVETIGDWAFNYSGLTSVTLPDGLVAIGDCAFKSCRRLASVVLPDGITRIGHGAFRECSGLTSVTFPNGVTRIGNDAFHGCSGLTSVILPDGVVQIGAHAFQDCEWLVVASLPSSLQRIEIGSLFLKGGIFGDCRRLLFVVAPPHVRRERDLHFTNCPMLGPLQEETPRSRLQMLRMQCWSLPTHRLCSGSRREWVATVMLVVARLRSLNTEGELPLLPIEMWFLILEFVPRWELGPNA